MTSSDEEITVENIVKDFEDDNNYGDLKKLVANQVDPYKAINSSEQRDAIRSVTFENIKNNMDSWGIVASEMDRERTINYSESSVNKYQDFKPIKSELADVIDDILDKEKLTRKSQINIEETAAQSITEEEMRKRMELLAQYRKLQFKNELKARRWKKIKSKAFRRLHRKDMSEIPLEELAEVDPEAFQIKLNKIENERAKERVTLRHKNTSAWVKRVLNRGLKAATEDEKRSYEEQLKLGEEITRKLALRNQEADFEEEDVAENPIEETPALQSLTKMKFIRDATLRRNKEEQELLESMKNEIFGQGDSNIQEDNEDVLELTDKKSDTGHKDKVKEDSTLDKSVPLDDNVIKPKVEKNTDEELKVEEKQKLLVNSGESTIPKSNPWLVKKKKTRVISANYIPLSGEELLINDNVNNDIKIGQQEELAQMLGFEEEFKREKEMIAQRDAEENLISIDKLHVKGFGSWAGAGAVESEKAKKRKERLIKERKDIIEKAIKERRDANNDEAIFNEGDDPAIMKYSLQSLPHGFTTKKQLETLQNFPVGPEFNSVTGFKTLVQPHIMAKAGVTIEPIFLTKMKRRKNRIDRMKNNRKDLETGNTRV